MNTIEKIEALPDGGTFSHTDTGEEVCTTDELKEIVDSLQALLRSAKRVNGAMHGNPTYMNVAFTMRTAIEKAERLTGTRGKEVPEGDKPLL